jgi:hypothetical protein
MFSLFKKKENINLNQEKLKMIKKFRNAINNYFFADVDFYTLNEKTISASAVAKRQHNQKRKLLEIIGKWEKELKESDK